jgi:hypothetical protein
LASMIKDAEQVPIAKCVRFTEPVAPRAVDAPPTPPRAKRRLVVANASVSPAVRV